MHSYDDRIRAVELYFRFGKRLTVVVRELGYPSVNSLAGGLGFLRNTKTNPGN